MNPIGEETQNESESPSVLPNSFRPHGLWPLSSSGHGILQVRVLEGGSHSPSPGFPGQGIRSQVSCLAEPSDS